MTLTALLNKYDIKYFTEKEIKDVSSELDLEKAINIIPTILVIDAMRDELGFPIKLTSVYRSWKDHERIYKEINEERVKEGKTLITIPQSSMHLEFNAVDCRPSDRDAIKLMEMKTWLKQFRTSNIKFEGKELNNQLMGIGFSYSSFVHADTRGILGKHSPSRW